MLQIVQITRVDGVPVSVKFSNGVIRYYDVTHQTWIASMRETRAINEALVGAPSA